MSVSDQGEAANKETKELQPIKHDYFRGQKGDKMTFSPAAARCPLEGLAEEDRACGRLTEDQHGYFNNV